MRSRQRRTGPDCLIIISFRASNSFLCMSKFCSVIHGRLTRCTRAYLKFPTRLIVPILPARLYLLIEPEELFIFCLFVFDFFSFCFSYRMMKMLSHENFHLIEARNFSSIYYITINYLRCYYLFIIIKRSW